MIPPEPPAPENPPPDIPEVSFVPPPEPARGEAYWDYQDLAVFICLSVVSLFAALMAVYYIPVLRALATPYKLVIGQLIWYVLVFSCLAAILRLRYDRPFWSSLGWRATAIGTAVASFFVGPLLAIAVGIAGAAMRTPQIHLPFEGMLKGVGLLVLFGVLIVVIGPLCEELAFRGFMMPLFIRSLGAPAGIIITGILFGGLHAFEYPDWRPVVLVCFAGCVFGWRRYETGSTVNSMLMHAGFNLIQFVGLLATQPS
jgi:membrane protease YdiL (CAAX protease family)